MSGRPRVLYLINGFQRGGAEQGLIRLVEGGAFRGCDLTVAGVVGGAPEIIAALRSGGARVEVLVDRPDMTPRALAAAAPKLAGLIARVRPQVCVLSLPQANLLGRLLTLAAPKTVIASFEHNTHLSKRVYERGYRLTSGRVDWLLADAETTATVVRQRLYTREPKAVVVLPLVSFPPTPPPARTPHAGPLRLVNAARFTRVKNQAALIRAADLLTRRGVAVELTLLGEGPELAACRALAEELGVGDRVHTPGFVKGWAQSPAFDAFVLASRHEGLCIAALEAMNGGLAVVAPRIGGLCDYGSDEVMRAVPDVEPATLAEAIAALDADRALAARLGAAAHAMVQSRFSDAAVHAAYGRFADRIHAAAA